LLSVAEISEYRWAGRQSLPKLNGMVIGRSSSRL
jgi:hypothetical protein